MAANVEKYDNLKVVKVKGKTSYGGILLEPEVDSDEPSKILKTRYSEITNEMQIGFLKEFIFNEKKIKEEFHSISYKKYYKCLVARKDENIEPKHRFHLSQAYDYNRVVLNVKFADEDKNDYISASRVDSFTVPGRFIVTQAPLPETFNDFWQMVYENNCTQILTLNALIEDGWVLGHKYWPENCAAKFFEITVTNYETKEKDDFAINFYEVSGFKGLLKVEHYFYKQWPDLGAPECQSFLHLLDTVKKSNAHQPIHAVVVHCSAGVGRSGAFILLYNMIEMGEKCGKVDVYKYFLQLRSQRAYSVGNIEQYTFVYNCLNSYFNDSQ